MTDKELIKQEIERRLPNLWYLIPEGEKVLQDNFTKEDANNLGKYTALESILRFIESLPEEHNDDLEEAADKYAYNEFPSIGIPNTVIELAFKAGAEWQKKKSMQDFLGKAERYLNYTLYDGVEIKVFGTLIPSIVSKKEFIDNFKNYIENESEN